MENTTTKKKFPAWAWALGCLALVSVCGVLLISAGILAAVLTVSRTSNPFDASLAGVNIGDTVIIEPTHDSSQATDDSITAPPIETPDAAPPTESPSEDSATATSPPRVVLAADPFASERSVIESNVAEIRQLMPKEDVVPTQLTKEQLRVRLEDEFAEEYPPDDARMDAIVLSTFDFVTPEFDIYNLVLDLLSEQIGGFYDPESDEFVVISDDEEFDALEQWTHAHEYVHALQDQHYDLEMLDDESLDSDTVFALQALTEGDATLVQTLYLTSGFFDREQMFELLGDAFTIDTAIYDSAPPFLAHELEFPYISGMEFVQALYDQGGFAAVDQAWENPPQSTEQIIHPDRYLNDDGPQVVTLEPLIDTLGDGWQLADDDSLGEFYLREYLIQQLDDSDVNEAATGWGGDRYAVYWNEADQASVMVLKLAWDTDVDADEFISAYANYPTRLFGSQAETQPDNSLCWTGDDVICLHQSAGNTLIVRAPDLKTAANVASVQNR